MDADTSPVASRRNAPVNVCKPKKHMANIKLMLVDRKKTRIPLGQVLVHLSLHNSLHCISWILATTSSVRIQYRQNLANPEF